jgi:hypothetical protein
MAAELTHQGVEHELIALRGRGHAFDQAGLTDPTVCGVFDRVLAFLEEHLTSG